MNKYARIPDFILDLHGFTIREAEKELEVIFRNKSYTHVRVITGKGTQRETGPILKTFVRGYLLSRGIHYNPAKQQDGGEGAVEVFLK